MLAPDAADLRPGDFVKLRGTVNSAHTGGKAVVVAIHRAQVSPWAVEAIDVRYSARGVAIRVELHETGVLARWDAPWPQQVALEHVVHHEIVTAGVAEPGTRIPRRRLVAAIAALAVPVAAGVVWAQNSHEVAPNPAVVQRNLVEAARGPGTATGGSGLPVDTTSPGTTSAPIARIVAYASGPVPIVSEPGSIPHAVSLAGLTPAAGCHDEYVAQVFDLLRIGTGVTVSGSGWFRTEDGIEVNSELVRLGVAIPAESTKGPGTGDAANYAALLALAPEQPRNCS